MRKIIIILSIFCAIALTASAQNAKFGKPTAEEWNLNSTTTDAGAVVLYKSVDVTYNMSGSFTALGSGGDGSLDDNRIASSGTSKYINPDNTTMLYDVKLRIKVLAESGIGCTALDVIYFSEDEDMNMRDDFYEMSVVVLRQVDGKVKKKKVAASNFKDERIDKHYMMRHVRVPDVEVGDIVEYQYKLFSNRCTYIYDTQLQENIPVLYAKCRMEIPYLLQFNVNRPMISNVKASAERGNLLIKSTSNDNQLPRKVATNVFTIEATDLPAYAGDIDLKNLTDGTVHCVRTELQDKRYDVKPGLSGPVRHLIIGK